MPSSERSPSSDPAGDPVCPCVPMSSLSPCHAVPHARYMLSAGNVDSDYLWICDPIDGTTNFTHSYPPFAISVGCLEKGVPVAAAICEFAGSKGNWHTRFYTAYKGGGAFVDGQRISVSKADNVERSLLVGSFASCSCTASMRPIAEVSYCTTVKRLIRAGSVW